jgi:hypothetical protein
MKNKQILIWGVAIVGISLAGYVAYSLLKKPEETNKPLLSPGTIKGIGDFLGSIFGKKAENVSPQTGYTVDSGINWYDTGLGQGYVDSNYPYETVQEG